MKKFHNYVSNLTILSRAMEWRTRDRQGKSLRQHIPSMNFWKRICGYLCCGTETI